MEISMISWVQVALKYVTLSEQMEICNDTCEWKVAYSHHMTIDYCHFSYHFRFSQHLYPLIIYCCHFQ